MPNRWSRAGIIDGSFGAPLQGLSYLAVTVDRVHLHISPSINWLNKIFLRLCAFSPCPHEYFVDWWRHCVQCEPKLCENYECLFRWRGSTCLFLSCHLIDRLVCECQMTDLITSMGERASLCIHIRTFGYFSAKCWAVQWYDLQMLFPMCPSLINEFPIGAKMPSEYMGPIVNDHDKTNLFVSKVSLKWPESCCQPAHLRSFSHNGLRSFWYWRLVHNCNTVTLGARFGLFVISEWTTVRLETR